MASLPQKQDSTGHLLCARHFHILDRTGPLGPGFYPHFTERKLRLGEVSGLSRGRIARIEDRRRGVVSPAPRLPALSFCVSLCLFRSLVVSKTIPLAYPSSGGRQAPCQAGVGDIWIKFIRVSSSLTTQAAASSAQGWGRARRLDASSCLPRL